MTTNISSAPSAAIVVAVDGSPTSAHALRWALDRAKQLDCPVRVVTAYPSPTATSEAARSYWTMHEAAAHAARRRAQATIDRVAPFARLAHMVRVGAPHAVIADEAGDARMIVIGTRARARWWHRFRPSLTNRLTGLVTCPVVSIPAAVPTAIPATPSNESVSEPV